MVNITYDSIHVVINEVIRVIITSRLNSSRLTKKHQDLNMLLVELSYGERHVDFLIGKRG